MKNKFLLFLIFITAITTARSQNAGDVYALNADVVLRRFNSFTGMLVATTDIYQAHRGDIFTIHAIVSVGGVNGYNIIFWDFKKAIPSPPPAGGIIFHNIDNADNGINYFIDETTFKAFTTSTFRKPHGAVKIDAVVLPIKIRFKNKQPGGEFDFEQSISVGPAISFNHNYGGAFGKTSSSFLLGFNVTNVSADDKTAPGVLTSKTTLLALSPFTGFTLDYEGINFSLLAGIDILTGNAGTVWAYRKSPWVGISIGTSLYSPEKKKQ